MDHMCISSIEFSSVIPIKKSYSKILKCDAITIPSGATFTKLSPTVPLDKSNDVEWRLNLCVRRKVEVPGTCIVLTIVTNRAYASPKGDGTGCPEK